MTGRAGWTSPFAVVIAIALPFVALFALLYVGNEGIPFIEGDTVVTTGKAYGFRIGMNRRQCLSVVREQYDRPEYYLRVVWPKNVAVDEVLGPYENTDWANYEMRRYGEYKQLVSEIAAINPPLELAERWDIDMPADWVNTIYLTFEGDTLIEIQKSRWLFERP